MKTFLVFAWRWLRSDCRSAEFRLLAFSLWLSTSLIIGLSGFMDKVQVMLVGQSSEFLAADRVLSSPTKIDNQWLDKATNLAIEQATTLSFQSMLYLNDEPLLVSAKAVSAKYPLKGQLAIRDTLYGDSYQVSHGPIAGELWADARLMMQLGAKIGDTVGLGEADFVLSQELVSEPDRGAGSFSMGPRVLIHWEDIEKTEVVQFGSRLNYRYLFAGSAKSLDALGKVILPDLTPSQKWLDLEQSQPSIAVALKRGQNFFLLASSIVVILASIATAMAGLRYASGHIKHIAVLKSLGASQATINTLVLGILSVLFIAVYALGSVTGFSIQTGLIHYIASSMKLPLPDILLIDELKAYVLGGMSCLLSLTAFVLPVLWRLSQVPAKTIFQQNAQQTLPVYKESLLLWLLACAILIGLYSRSLVLSAALLAVLLLIILVLSLPVWAILKQLSQLPLRAASAWQLAMSQLTRRLIPNVILCGIFSFCLSLLFILFAMQSALFEQWRSQLPKDSPNFFVVNMQAEQLNKAREFIANKELASEPLYPIVRGRLIKINESSVRDLVSKEKLKRAGVDRELSLSAVSELPADNIVAEGVWWPKVKSLKSNKAITLPAVSVESQLAERLGLALGDRLSFQIAADILEVQVTSFRKVEWDRMKPNFYMLFEEGTLVPFSKTYMTSFYLPDDQHQQVIELLQALPNAVLIDVDHLIKQIQSIVSQVSVGLRWVVLFVLLSSILVLVSLVQSSMPERMNENAILRSLGASKERLLGALVIEFFSLGFVAGVFAVMVGQIALMVLQAGFLELPISLQIGLWWFPPVLGGGLITLAGVWCSRAVVNQSPLAVLNA